VQTAASKQTMDTVSRLTAADAGGSPEAWCLVGGEVGLNGVDQVPGSAAECSGSSGPAARAVE
jgi:hypothetical protein